MSILESFYHQKMHGLTNSIPISLNTMENSEVSSFLSGVKVGEGESSTSFGSAPTNNQRAAPQRPTAHSRGSNLSGAIAGVFQGGGVRIGGNDNNSVFNQYRVDQPETQPADSNQPNKNYPIPPVDETMDEEQGQTEEQGKSKGLYQSILGEKI